MRTPGLQVNSILALVAALQGGAGIGELPTWIGDEVTGLTRVLPEIEAAYDVWLGTHGDLHRTARVRLLIDAIARQFGA
jgi:DNA-binding transcriptional LysR family regulator